MCTGLYMWLKRKKLWSYNWFEWFFGIYGGRARRKWRAPPWRSDRHRWQIANLNSFFSLIFFSFLFSFSLFPFFFFNSFFLSFPFPHFAFSLISFFYFSLSINWWPNFLGCLLIVDPKKVRVFLLTGNLDGRPCYLFLYIHLIFLISIFDFFSNFFFFPLSVTDYFVLRNFGSPTFNFVR